MATYVYINENFVLFERLAVKFNLKTFKVYQLPHHSQYWGWRGTCG